MEPTEGQLMRRVIAGETPPLVWCMLVVPPLLLLFSLLWPGSNRERPRARAGWCLSAAGVTERASALQKLIEPEAVVSQITLEQEEGVSRDGSWRGLWRSNVCDSHGYLFAAVWEDTTGELVMFNRTFTRSAPLRNGANILQSEAAAEQAAKNWLGKLYPTKTADWRPLETKTSGIGYWRTAFVGPEGRLLIELEAATGTPTYFVFRSRRSTQMR